MEKQVIELYNQCLTVKQIAAKLHLSKSYIYQVLDSYGIIHF